MCCVLRVRPIPVASFVAFLKEIALTENEAICHFGDALLAKSLDNKTLPFLPLCSVRIALLF